MGNKFETLADIKEANRNAGLHWFSPDTVRFFKSRFSEDIYPLPDGGAMFVSSERGPDDVRAYSVRLARADGSIETVGGFQAHATSRAAHAAAKFAAAQRRTAPGGYIQAGV